MSPPPCPDWFSAVDCGHLADACTQAECRREARGPHVIGLAYPSEAAAIDAFMIVFTEFLAVLDARRDRAPNGTDLIRVADDYRDHLIMWIRSMTIGPPPLEPFATQARAAIERSGFWTTFVSPKPTRAVALQHPQQNTSPASRPDDRSPLLSLRIGARQLGMHEDTLLKNYPDSLRKVGGRWKISQAEVDRLKKEDPQIRSRLR